MTSYNEYEERFAKLPPKPERGDAYYDWLGLKDACGAIHGEGIDVIGVLGDGSQVAVSTENRYRVVEVPSGYVLYEMLDFEEAKSMVDSVAGSRKSDDDPYAIAVTYELVAAVSRLCEPTPVWGLLSVKPPIGKRRCGLCGRSRDECESVGSNWVRHVDPAEDGITQDHECMRLEAIRIQDAAAKIAYESGAMGVTVDYETSGVIDDRYEWQYPPDMSHYEWIPAHEVQWRRDTFNKAYEQAVGLALGTIV